MNLSIKRAKHVKNELIRLGVDKNLFKIVKGKGEVVIRKFDEVQLEK